MLTAARKEKVSTFPDEKENYLKLINMIITSLVKSHSLFLQKN